MQLRLFSERFSPALLGEKITVLKSLGFAFGIAGVGLVTGIAPGTAVSSSRWAMAACLLAAASYGFVSVYVKRFAASANPRAIATGSQLMAGLLLLPLSPLLPPPGPVDAFHRREYDLIRLIEQRRGVFVVLSLNREYWPDKSIDRHVSNAGVHDDLGRAISQRKDYRCMIVGCALILLGTAMVVVRK
jgi:hypothetical protein